MTPFLLAFAAIMFFGAGAATSWLIISTRIRNSTTYQKAVDRAHKRGVIEGQARRAQNLPPSQILPPEYF